MIRTETERALWAIARGLALLALAHISTHGGASEVRTLADELEQAARYRSETDSTPPAAPANV